MYIGKADFVMV